MKNSMVKFIGITLSIFLVTTITGCSMKFYRGHPEDLEKISELSSRIQELEDAKALLESRLKDEIRDKQVKIDITKRGLVITFVAEVLFDSGQAVLKQGAYPILDKVVSVIKEKVSGRNIGIEGHTDNQPIKYSGWKSNWELSTSRATTVLHYLEDSGIDPKKLQATGFGEYRPVASNDMEEGRQQNRRVEIVILPGELDKFSYSEPAPGAKEPEVK
jgi:chemotaxis protein MotB